jgi:hypothetical protein
MVQWRDLLNREVPLGRTLAFTLLGGVVAAAAMTGLFVAAVLLANEEVSLECTDENAQEAFRIAGLDSAGLTHREGCHESSSYELLWGLLRFDQCTRFYAVVSGPRDEVFAVLDVAGIGAADATNRTHTVVGGAEHEVSFDVQTTPLGEEWREGHRLTQYLGGSERWSRMVTWGADTGSDDYLLGVEAHTTCR